MGLISLEVCIRFGKLIFLECIRFNFYRFDGLEFRFLGFRWMVMIIGSFCREGGGAR